MTVTGQFPRILRERCLFNIHDLQWEDLTGCRLLKDHRIEQFDRVIIIGVSGELL